MPLASRPPYQIASKSSQRQEFQMRPLVQAISIAVCGIALYAIQPQPAMAQAQTTASNQSARHNYSIPAGPLGSALRSLASSANLLLTFTETQTNGKTTSGLNGRYTPEAALTTLLTGTGLQPVPLESGGYILRASSSNDSSTKGAESVLPAVSVTALSTGDDNVGYVARRSSTATKTDTPIIETPSSISVITREQLESQQVKTVAQALRYTPGVATEIAGGQVIADQFIVRGFQQGTGRILRDGLRSFPSDYLGWDAPEPYGLESVEVLRGASSVLFGAADPGGQINLVTKRAPSTPLKQIQVQVGSHDYRHAAFDIGGPIDTDSTLSYRLTGLVRESSLQTDHIDNRRVFLAPTVTWRPTAMTELTVLAEYQEQKGNFANPLPANGTLLANANGVIPRSRYIGDPSFDESSNKKFSIGYLFQHRLNDTFRFRQNLRYSDIRHNSSELAFYGWTNSAQRIADRYADIRRGSGDVLSIDNQLQADFKTSDVSHTVLAGLDYSRSSYDQWQQLGFASPLDLFTPTYGNVSVSYFPASEYKQTVNQTGVYLQDQIKFGQHWSLLLGGRYDWVRNENSASWASAPLQSDSKFSSRAGLVYLADNGLAPYVSYSESFLPTTGKTFTNQIFKPEIGKQYEVGMKYQPPGKESLYTVALFDLAKRNVSTPDPLHSGYNVQEGEIRSRGLELEAKTKIASNLDIIAAYTYNDVKVQKSNEAAIVGNRPFRVPEQIASVWLDYKIKAGPLAGLGLGGGVRYSGFSYGDRENSFKVPAYTIFDAVVRYRPANWRQVELTLNAMNLFDKQYVAACYSTNGCQYGQARTVYATINYNW